MATCYRHPSRETGVSCSACGRPICPDCMTPTPVGMRCPECARQRTRVTRGSAAFAPHFPATLALIAINVIVYVIEIAKGPGGLSNPSGHVLENFGLYGPFVSEGDWYRLLTSGFLHASLGHIFFNMLALFFLGRLLETGIGSTRFVFVYFASLLAGSFGALLLSPESLTLGASGAVFGLFGAALVIARGRGLDALARTIGIILVLNLAFTLGVPHISIGAHLGGLAGGVLCSLVIVEGERGRLGAQRIPAELFAMATIGIISALAAIAIA
jgi:membrane associated rhomboid family serine protease